MVAHPDGSRIIFSGEPGASPGQQILAPQLAHEVVISPGLPTPPPSPFRSARLPSGDLKVHYSATNLLETALRNAEVDCVKTKQVRPPVEMLRMTGYTSFAPVTYVILPLKVPELNGSGSATLSFGAYYGPSQSNGRNIHHSADK